MLCPQYDFFYLGWVKLFTLKEVVVLSGLAISNDNEKQNDRSATVSIM